MKTDEITGKCKICGINCWKSAGGKPKIWPCGIDKCPYPAVKPIHAERSTVGSGLSMIVPD